MKDKVNKNIELLSPAGDMERLISAVNFGADAVYLAGKSFGMRTSSPNFTDEQLKKAIKYAHDNNVRVYLACNVLPRNEEIKQLPEFLENVSYMGIDALIVSDIGVMDMAKRYAVGVDIHISTQAGIVNYETANSFYNMGASRVVLARELSLEEIKQIRDNTSQKLEIEAFVHGSMCVSFSGRCLISSYLTGRDANRGDCTQPCRWKYHLVEENRPGQYFPVIENDQGTYFFNSKDLCMIEHIRGLVNAGITSFKIEGRAKSSYYVSVITNAYRNALDDYYKMGTNWVISDWIKEEVNKVSHREYNTGFFFGSEPGQVYNNGGYVREYEVVGVCEDYKNGIAQITQRNKFFKGDKVEILEPMGKPFAITIEEIYDEYNNSLTEAPHAMQKLFIPISKSIKKGSLIRKVK